MLLLAAMNALVKTKRYPVAWRLADLFKMPDAYGMLPLHLACCSSVDAKVALHIIHIMQLSKGGKKAICEKILVGGKVEMALLLACKYKKNAPVIESLVAVMDDSYGNKTHIQEVARAYEKDYSCLAKILVAVRERKRSANEQWRRSCKAKV